MLLLKSIKDDRLNTKPNYKVRGNGRRQFQGDYTCLGNLRSHGGFTMMGDDLWQYFTSLQEKNTENCYYVYITFK